MNEINEQGLFIGDVFILNYYGIKLFFQVCKTTKNSVYIVELATKKYKNGIMLTKNLKASDNPFIVQENNRWTKSNYKVFPLKLYDEYWLPIEIKYGSKLYEAARKYNDCPSFGYAYAFPIKDYYNKYWICDKIESIEIKIMA